MIESNFVEVRKANFLSILDEYKGAPSHLFYRGKLPPHRSPTVAIVGSRRPTHYGKEVTYDLAYKLAQRGVIIVSGLALGIDAIAHRAALDAGGVTIAVMAGGLDEIYPRTHERLAREIIEKGGALLSEYADGIPAMPFQFLARNRIVSGIADAVVITEAAARSGTLSTTTHALDQNKEIFAVPGNITSVLSVGPNKLLQQGAHPVTEVGDILEMISPNTQHVQIQLAVGSTPLEQTIIDLIRSGVKENEQLQQQSNKEVSEVLTALTMLEINGIIRNSGGNHWTLT